jgi:deoxyhypusine synthase
MNKKNGPSLGHNKKSLLKSEVKHIDITSFDSRKIIDSMKKMSFTSRDTAKAAEIYNEMIKIKIVQYFLQLQVLLLLQDV